MNDPLANTYEAALLAEDAKQNTIDFSVFDTWEAKPEGNEFDGSQTPEVAMPDAKGAAPNIVMDAPVQQKPAPQDPAPPESTTTTAPAKPGAKTQPGQPTVDSVQVKKAGPPVDIIGKDLGLGFNPETGYSKFIPSNLIYQPLEIREPFTLVSNMPAGNMLPHMSNEQIIASVFNGQFSEADVVYQRVEAVGAFQSRDYLAVDRILGMLSLQKTMEQYNATFKAEGDIPENPLDNPVFFEELKRNRKQIRAELTHPSAIAEAYASQVSLLGYKLADEAFDIIGAGPLQSRKSTIIGAGVGGAAIGGAAYTALSATPFVVFSGPALVAASAMAAVESMTTDQWWNAYIERNPEHATAAMVTQLATSMFIGGPIEFGLEHVGRKVVRNAMGSPALRGSKAVKALTRKEEFFKVNRALFGNLTDPEMKDTRAALLTQLMNSGSIETGTKWAQIADAFTIEAYQFLGDPKLRLSTPIGPSVASMDEKMANTYYGAKQEFEAKLYGKDNGAFDVDVNRRVEELILLLGAAHEEATGRGLAEVAARTKDSALAGIASKAFLALEDQGILETYPGIAERLLGSAGKLEPLTLPQLREMAETIAPDQVGALYSAITEEMVGSYMVHAGFNSPGSVTRELVQRQADYMHSNAMKVMAKLEDNTLFPGLNLSDYPIEVRMVQDWDVETYGLLETSPKAFLDVAEAKLQRDILKSAKSIRKVGFSPREGVVINPEGKATIGFVSTDTNDRLLARVAYIHDLYNNTSPIGLRSTRGDIAVSSVLFDPSQMNTRISVEGQVARIIARSAGIKVFKAAKEVDKIRLGEVLRILPSEGIKAIPGKPVRRFEKLVDTGNQVYDLPLELREKIKFNLDIPETPVPAVVTDRNDYAEVLKLARTNPNKLPDAILKKLNSSREMPDTTPLRAQVEEPMLLDTWLKKYDEEPFAELYLDSPNAGQLYEYMHAHFKDLDPRSKKLMNELRVAAGADKTDLIELNKLPIEEQRLNMRLKDRDRADVIEWYRGNIKGLSPRTELSGPALKRFKEGAADRAKQLNLAHAETREDIYVAIEDMFNVPTKPKTNKAVGREGEELPASKTVDKPIKGIKKAKKLAKQLVDEAFRTAERNKSLRTRGAQIEWVKKYLNARNYTGQGAINNLPQVLNKTGLSKNSRTMDALLSGDTAAFDAAIRRVDTAMSSTKGPERAMWEKAKAQLQTIKTNRDVATAQGTKVPPVRVTGPANPYSSETLLPEEIAEGVAKYKSGIDGTDDYYGNVLRQAESSSFSDMPQEAVDIMQSVEAYNSMLKDRLVAFTGRSNATFEELLKDPMVQNVIRVDESIRAESKRLAGTPHSEKMMQLQLGFLDKLNGTDNLKILYETLESSRIKQIHDARFTYQMAPESWIGTMDEDLATYTSSARETLSNMLEDLDMPYDQLEGLVGDLDEIKIDFSGVENKLHIPSSIKKALGITDFSEAEGLAMLKARELKAAGLDTPVSKLGKDYTKEEILEFVEAARQSRRYFDAVGLSAEVFSSKVGNAARVPTTTKNIADMNIEVATDFAAQAKATAANRIAAPVSAALAMRKMGVEGKSPLPAAEVVELRKVYDNVTAQLDDILQRFNLAESTRPPRDPMHPKSFDEANVNLPYLLAVDKAIMLQQAVRETASTGRVDEATIIALRNLKISVATPVLTANDLDKITKIYYPSIKNMPVNYNQMLMSDKRALDAEIFKNLDHRLALIKAISLTGSFGSKAAQKKNRDIYTKFVLGDMVGKRTEYYKKKALADKLGISPPIKPSEVAKRKPRGPAEEEAILARDKGKRDVQKALDRSAGYQAPTIDTPSSSLGSVAQAEAKAAKNVAEAEEKAAAVAAKIAEEDRLLAEAEAILNGTAKPKTTAEIRAETSALAKAATEDIKALKAAKSPKKKATTGPTIDSTKVRRDNAIKEFEAGYEDYAVRQAKNKEAAIEAVEKRFDSPMAKDKWPNAKLRLKAKEEALQQIEGQFPAIENAGRLKSKSKTTRLAEKRKRKTAAKREAGMAKTEHSTSVAEKAAKAKAAGTKAKRSAAAKKAAKTRAANKAAAEKVATEKAAAKAKRAERTRSKAIKAEIAKLEAELRKGKK